MRNVYTPKRHLLPEREVAKARVRNNHPIRRLFNLRRNCGVNGWGAYFTYRWERVH